MIDNKFKRQVDDWIEMGICARHKYINKLFKFLWHILKKSFKSLLLLLFFMLGLLFYKYVWNNENRK